MSVYFPPEPLASHHELSRFECRSPEQTEWLRHHARQAHAAGTAKVFVVTDEGGQMAVAYYAWCMASLAAASAPGRLRKGSGRYPQPVALLARLGVDLGHERRGLGAALLKDVFMRVASLSEDIGCRALLVHAESEEAKQFYCHLVPDFEDSPTDELQLVLLLKDIKKTLGT